MENKGREYSTSSKSTPTLKYIHTILTFLKRYQVTTKLLKTTSISRPPSQIFLHPTIPQHPLSYPLFPSVVEEQLRRRRKEHAQDPGAFKEQHPFLSSLLERQDIAPTDVFLLVLEVFQGGIDAVGDDDL